MTIRVVLPSTDLAEFRMLRALRAGQPGAFPSLWNAQAGALWSVTRALCATDAEALGWMASFRVELGERAPSFSADRPLGPQVGEALYTHLLPQCGDFAPPVPARLTPDLAGVALIPSGMRLAYLVALYFDVDAEALPGMDATRVAALREVARRLEPGDDTDAHLLIHTVLLRSPPVAALILPPGSEPATPPSRAGWYALGGALVIALLTSNAVLDHVVRPLWTRWRPPPESAGLPSPAEDAAEGVAQVVVEGDGAEIAHGLAANGVPSALAEVPLLDSLGLHVAAARVWWGPDPTVRLLYVWMARRPGVWMLDHRFGAAITEGPVLARSGEGDETLEARQTTLGVSVAWAERDTRWALCADAPAEEVLRVAAAIRTLRSATGPTPAGGPLLFPDTVPPSRIP